MSESSFPFEAQAEPAPMSEEGESSRKPVMLVGGLVAALVLGAGGFLLLGGGGGEEEDFSVPPRAAQAAAPAAEPAPIAVIPAASTEVVGRNPFKARYVEPVAAPVPAEAPKAAPSALPLPPPQPVQITLQQPAPAPAAEEAPAQYPITLVSVSEPQPEARTVTWKIDDKELTVLPGQRFGKYGELVVLAYTTSDDGTTITGVILQVGDATPFDALLGQTYDVL